MSFKKRKSLLKIKKLSTPAYTYFLKNIVRSKGFLVSFLLFSLCLSSLFIHWVSSSVFCLETRKKNLTKTFWKEIPFYTLSILIQTCLMVNWCFYTHTHTHKKGCWKILGQSQEARQKISDVVSDFYFGKWAWPRPFSTRTVYFSWCTHTHTPLVIDLDKK